MYSVKEIFATLQGEGANQGRTAVFLRFAGCNLWSGLEKDRASSVCQFCDTDFVGVGPQGGKFKKPGELAEAVEAVWPGGHDRRFIVLTGGEPLLQTDGEFIAALHARRFFIAIETNGTLHVPKGIDWICVSPKGGAPLVQTAGDELKLVFPQKHAPPPAYEHLEFSHFFLQPMDGPSLKANIEATVAYCLANPKWRLSLQTHKMIGIA